MLKIILFYDSCDDTKDVEKVSFMYKNSGVARILRMGGQFRSGGKPAAGENFFTLSY